MSSKIWHDWSIKIVCRSRSALFASTSLCAAVLLPYPALAQLAGNATPSGGSVVAGAAAISQTPGITTITQSSQRTAINWQSFDVGSQAKVDFNQPDASAIALNRVTGGNLSTINGQINANGQIVLINQSGAVFGRGAQINAESVVVSASDISTSDFMAGRMNFTGAPKPGAQIINNGEITARSAGLVGLVAPQVANSGVITAQLGQVILAGASAFTLDLYGDRLISLDVTQAVRSVDVNGQKVPALVTNSGLIIADGGKVTLTAQDADALVTELINGGGTIRADTMGSQTGTISIQGVGGDIRIAGNLLAQGITQGSQGGAIEALTAGTVAVATGANIDASGNRGGGYVAIGTNIARARSGPSDSLAPAASFVSIAPGATISADATGIGNGGTLTLLSQLNTDFLGGISARGGGDGNGGLAEISSRGVIELGGTVLTTAIDGKPGEILLDPATLVVSAGSPQDTVSSTSENSASVGGYTGTDTTYIDPATLATLSGTIELDAGTLLEVASPVNLPVNDTYLHLNAGAAQNTGTVVIDQGVTLGGSSSELDVAAGTIDVGVGAALSAYNINMTAGNGGIETDSAISASYAIALNAEAGTIDVGVGAALSAPIIDLVTNVSVANDGLISIDGVISASDYLDLGNVGSVDEGGNGSVITPVLFGQAVGDLLLGHNNRINAVGEVFEGGNVVNLSAGGTFDLNDAVSLDVVGKITAADVTLVTPELTADAPVVAGLYTPGTLAIAADTIQTSSLTIANFDDDNFNNPGTVVSAGSFSAPQGTIELAPYSFTEIDVNGTDANALDLSAQLLNGMESGANAIQIGRADAFRAANVSLDGDSSFSSPVLIISASNLISDAGSLTAGTLEIDGGGFSQGPSGAVIADLLKGDGAPIDGDVRLDSPGNSIGTIGSIDTGDSDLILNNAGPLTLTGPLVANAVSLTAQGQLTLDGSETGGLFVNGSFAAPGTTVASAGDSVITVDPTNSGAPATIIQTGTFFINAGSLAESFTTAPADATVFLSNPSGNIEFGTASGLVAPSVDLILDAGDSGSITGDVTLHSVVIVDAESTQLFGSLDNIVGQPAATKGFNYPDSQLAQQFNGCEIGAAECGITSGGTSSTGSPGNSGGTSSTGSPGNSGGTSSTGSPGNSGGTSSTGSPGNSGGTSSTGSPGNSGGTSSTGSPGNSGGTSSTGSPGNSGGTSSTGSPGNSGGTSSTGSPGNSGGTSSNGSGSATSSTGSGSATSPSGAGGATSSSGSGGTTSSTGSGNAASPSGSGSGTQTTVSTGFTLTNTQPDQRFINCEIDAADCGIIFAQVPKTNLIFQGLTEENVFLPPPDLTIDELRVRKLKPGVHMPGVGLKDY